MAECKIIINDNAGLVFDEASSVKTSKNGENTYLFSNSQQLEDFLLANWDAITNYFKNKNHEKVGLKKLFSTLASPQENTIAKLQTVVEEAKKVPQGSAFSPSNMSRLAFDVNNENSPIYSGSYTGDWNKRIEDKYKDKYGESGKTTYRNHRSNFITNSGTWFHSYVEASITNDNSKIKRYWSFNYDTITNKAIETAKQIKDRIVSYFGKNIKLMAEVPISSSEFTKEFQEFYDKAVARLETSTNEDDRKLAIELKNQKGFSGRIDIVGIDSDGKLYLFDLKTTYQKAVSKNSNRAAEVQLAIYAEILKQKGFQIAGTYKIPVFLEGKTDAGKTDSYGNVIPEEKADLLEENGKFTLTNLSINSGIDDWIISFSPDRGLSTKIAHYFTYTPPTNTTTLAEDFGIFKQMFYQITDSTASASENEEKLIKRQILELKRTDRNRAFRLHRIEDLKQYKGEEFYNRKYTEGYRFYLPNFDEPVLGKRSDNENFYYKTEAEADEALQDYIVKKHAKRAEFYKNFAADLNEILTGKKVNKLEALADLSEKVNFMSKEYVYNLVYKYVKNGWNLEVNDELATNGIFIFTKNGKCEIINFVKHDLYDKVKLKQGSQTVLNNMILDTEVGSDDSKTLNTLYGNIMAMRMMLILSRHRDLIKPGCKVQAIRVANIYLEQCIDESVGKLASTWDKFCFYWNDKNKVFQTDENDKTGKSSSARPELILLAPGKENSLIMNPVEAYLQRARDYMLIKSDVNWDFGFGKKFQDFFVNSDYSFNKILELFKEFKTEYRNYVGTISKLNFNRIENPIELAYTMLGSALLEAAQWMPSVEADVASLFDGALDGVRATSPAVSKSATLRLTQRLVASYEADLRLQYDKDMQDWQNQLSLALKERYGSDMRAEDLGSFFKDWLDPEKKYTMLNPDSNPYFNGKPEEKKLAKLFLQKMSEFRGDNGMNQHSEEYLQIPLLEQGFFDQLKDGVTFGGAVKAKYEKVRALATNLLKNTRKSNWESRQNENIDIDEIPNFYFMQTEESRQRMIEQKGDIFEKDLDMVMLYVALGNSRKIVSRKYIPYIAAMRSVLQLFIQVHGAYEPQIVDAVDDFVKLVVFGKNIAEERHRNLYSFISFLKGITSATTLKFNVKNFTRENLADFLRTSVAINSMGDASRAFSKGVKETESDLKLYEANELFLSHITAGDYSSALSLVFSGITDPKLMLKISKLNSIAGMANISQAQLANYNKHITKGLSMDEGYWTTTWPDFFHRNAILIAYMKDQGYWDAYSINENNQLVYDMTKDKRWTILYECDFGLDSKKMSIMSNEARKKFVKTYQTYCKYIEKWRPAHPELKSPEKVKEKFNIRLKSLEDAFKNTPGDVIKLLEKYNLDTSINTIEAAEKALREKALEEINTECLLPQGFTIDDTNSIRTWADKLYGSYDDATKALMQSQTLGSMFFQYKNYSLAMLSGWWASTTHINAEKLVQMRDEAGNAICAVTSTKEEFENTGKIVQYKPESEVTQEEWDQNRVEFVTWWESDPMKGKIQSAIELMQAIVRGDWETYKKLQESPIMRYNLALILYDSLLMGIIAGILKLLFGKEKVDKMKNQNFATRWSYAVLNGMTQDGSLTQTLKSIIGEGSMPSFSTLSTYFRNIMSVITGKRNAMYAMLNSFGATRELSAFFNDAREALE